jgi:hypothetical protein
LLRDNGGPTPTMALLPGSPAIDAGDNTGAPKWDQRGEGFDRIVNGVIDIGAFEVQAVAPTLVVPPGNRPAASAAVRLQAADAGRSGQEVVAVDRFFASLKEQESVFVLSGPRHDARGEVEAKKPRPRQPLAVDLALVELPHAPTPEEVAATR